MYFEDKEHGPSELDRFESMDGDHGRTEIQRYATCNDIDWLLGKECWAGLKTINGGIQTKRLKAGWKNNYMLKILNS
jgi:hypothetical protein